MRPRERPFATLEGVRNRISEAVASMLDFGAVLSTAMGANLSTTAKILMDEDPDGDEVVDGQEMWGHAPLLYRPANPDASGRCEVITLRRGDELVGLNTKDRRWQTTLLVGQVIIRALAANGGRIRLNTDGSIEIGIGGAQEFIAIGDAIASHFSALKTWMDAHTHSYLPGTGAATLTAPPTASPTVPTVKSSKHKVET